MRKIKEKKQEMTKIAKEQKKINDEDDEKEEDEDEDDDDDSDDNQEEDAYINLSFEELQADLIDLKLRHDQFK